MVPTKLKLKERLVIGICAVFVMLTLFLVVDVQTDMGFTGHHFMPSHGKIVYKVDDGPKAAFNSFRRRFLQKGNTSKESGSLPAGSTGSQQEYVGDKVTKVAAAEKQKKQKHDEFRELYELVFVRKPKMRDFQNDLEEFPLEGGRGERNPTLLQVLGLRGR